MLPLKVDKDKIYSSPDLRELEELKKELQSQIRDCKKIGLLADVTTVKISIKFKEVASQEEDKETDDEGELE